MCKPKTKSELRKEEYFKKANYIAVERGGKCLSEEYINNATKMLWECKEGHQWKACFKDVKNGTWCPDCSGNKKKTIEDCIKVAEERGGKCLSDEYIYARAKMIWECSEGHRWEASFNSVKNDNTWCPDCSGKKKKTIEDCIKVAEERDGKCLSDEYHNSNTMMIWECKEGHQWKASFNSVKNGTWCPDCSGSKKKTLEDCIKVAEERGGKCLSEEYINSSTKMLWECSEGHQWEAMYNNIHRKQWCPICCGNNIKKDISDCYNIAQERGGKCLSDEYHNGKTKMLWECSEGHKWKASFNSIQSGSWCPECSGSKKKTLEDCIKVAEERGGKCLSDEYYNNKTKMLWECKEGHQWEACFKSVKIVNTWCPYCAGKHITLEDCIKVAEERGGKCLSDEYHNSDTKMLWECSKGHQWDTSYGNIINSKTWCPYCAGRHITLEDCIKVAEKRGGKCLSSFHIDAKTYMTWECSEGHQWEATLNNVKNNNSWCPHCLLKGESKCKELLENYTGFTFIKNKPKWLINSRGNRMEFDGYNKKHRLAFEYHGEQHYEYNPHFHRNGESDLIQRQEDDKLKEQLAKEHGVRLIVIPYYVDDLEAFIYEELMKIDPLLIKLDLNEIINVEESSDIL